MSLLHGLELPDITCECLTDLVLLQISLLEYAAITPLATIQEGIKPCAQYLEHKVPRFLSRGSEIAKWFFDTRAKTRMTLLTDFAQAYQATGKGKAAQQRQKAWLKRIRKEISDLLDDNTPVLTVGDFFGIDTEGISKKDKKKPGEAKECTYQEAAEKFFLYFYDSYLGTDEEFPASIFTIFNEEPFGRQEILRSFITKNNGLEICAICDQSRYYVHGHKQIHGILDHYFPKKTYPHFACHPYNLIPVCYPCNSSVKGSRDPFINEKKERRPLLKKILPYRHRGSEQTYLEVASGKKAELIQIKGLKPRPNEAGEIDNDIQEAIDLLQHIYQLPGRWQYSDQTIKISDILFRRMRHFLNSGRIIFYGTDREAEIYNALKQLLYYLDADDQRRDPFAFAMTWILVSLLQSENTDRATWEGLIEEINSWSGTDLDLSNKRNAHVDALLKPFR